MTAPIGSISRNVATRTVTASTTVTLDDYQILADATGGAITVTLFTAMGDGAFYELVIQKTDSSANAVTVTDGTFTFSLAAQSDSVIVQQTAAGAWIGISGFDPSGTGDVEGPAVAVSGDIATFNGTTGKIIQDSAVAITTISVADSKAVSAAKGSPLGVVVVSATSVVTPNANATVALFEIWGAGGGGGGCSGAATSAAAGGGGGAGAYSAKWVTALAGSTFSIGIGASGASGAANAGTGGTGGSTLVSTVISAAGGIGGVGQAASTFLLPAAAGAGGAAPTTGDINYAGNPGAWGLRMTGTSAAGGNGGTTRLGGGGQGTAADAVGGDGGANTGAGGGGAASLGATSRTGGAGGTGVCIITYFR